MPDVTLYSSTRTVKPSFHDTDADILADILARILASRASRFGVVECGLYRYEIITGHAIAGELGYCSRSRLSVRPFVSFHSTF